MKDAYTPTRGCDSGRKAQLTVWDVLNLSIAEGSQAGEFKLGQKFLVSDGFSEEESHLTITPGDKFDAQASICLDGPWPWI